MRFHKFALGMVALTALSSSLPGNGVSFALADEAPPADEVVTSTGEEETLASFAPPENAESFTFEAEVHKMMDIVINSLYQNKDVFLRELISNASDALDKLRFLSLTEPTMLEGAEEFEVKIEYDDEAQTLTIRDTGIGMTKDDLVKNLGTVARSGTTRFMEALQEGEADMNMIGQFGVGFYSAFLVADRVRVASKHPNEPVQHIWESKNGEQQFLVAEDPRGNSLGRGTEIILHLKEDAVEYAQAQKLKDLVTHYSEFINHPIYVRTTTTTKVPKEKETTEEDGEGKDEEEKDDLEIEEEDDEKEEEEPEMEDVTTHSWDRVNTNQPIWTRDKDEISDDDYQAFWKTISKESWTNASTWIHFNAEGNINFKSLLYLPEEVPSYLRMGMMDKEQDGLKLYVRKVLISDSFELMPKYFSFIRGVVDSDDLPLNVNRETLQESKIIKVISKKLVRKVIEMLTKLSKKDTTKKEDEEESDTDEEKKEEGEDTEEKEEDEEEEEDKEHPYISWYKKFGPSLKMGVMEDDANRNKLAKLLRFKTSKYGGDDDWVSLEQYVERMKDWQDEIYIFAGEKVSDMENSSFLEQFKEKDVEVVYFTDPVDEYMINSMSSFDGKRFQSITKEGLKLKDEDEDLVKRREKAYTAKFQPLTTWMKKILGSSVTRVMVSKKLVNAPAVISSTDYSHSANMERILKAQAFQHGRQEHEYMAQKILEINPRHPFVTKLLTSLPEDIEEDAKKAPKNIIDGTWMLFDMALLNSGFPISNVKAYSKRMMRVIKTALDVDSLELEPEIDVPEEEDIPPEGDEDAEGINMDDFEFDSLEEEL